MRKRNPIARDLKTPKFKKRVFVNKKSKYKKGINKHDPLRIRLWDTEK